MQRVAYDRQTIDNPNPLARFAHRKRLHRSLSIAELQMGQGARVLDIGAGTGEFLHRLGEIRPDVDRIAFEPFMTLRYPDIAHQPALPAVADASIDAVTAFEVLEHLTEPLLEDFVAQTRRVLVPNGKLILSVPIMEGLALPVKELSRAILFRRMSDYSPRELVRGVVGRPVVRASDPLRSHKGFAHRRIPDRLVRHFEPLARVHSPFPLLPWWANSQIFHVFVRP